MEWWKENSHKVEAAIVVLLITVACLIGGILWLEPKS